MFICLCIVYESSFWASLWVWREGKGKGREDPLEKEMTVHSSILAWEIPRTEDTGGQQSMGLQKSQTALNN